MFDLHTHSFLSDGVLLPAELARRCCAEGYRGLVISDHVGPSNLESVVEALAAFAEAVAGLYEGLEVLPGCELTHVPPPLMAEMAERARAAGAEVVLAHGETIVEPVAPGTNRAAIEAHVDVLAHPGLITPEDARAAAELDVKLEISGRKGHSLTNGRVAMLAREAGAPMTFGSDGHAPGDYPTREFATRILCGAGLSDQQIDDVWATNAAFFGL
jgi:histidinol phosphatase-like PHP family hydrolase